MYTPFILFYIFILTFFGLIDNWLLPSVKYVINNCIYLSLYFVYYDYSILNSFCVDLRTLFLMFNLPIITTTLALAPHAELWYFCYKCVATFAKIFEYTAQFDSDIFPSRFFISLLFGAYFTIKFDEFSSAFLACFLKSVSLQRQVHQCPRLKEIIDRSQWGTEWNLWLLCAYIGMYILLYVYLSQDKSRFIISKTLSLFLIFWKFLECIKDHPSSQPVLHSLSVLGYKTNAKETHKTLFHPRTFIIPRVCWLCLPEKATYVLKSACCCFVWESQLQLSLTDIFSFAEFHDLMLFTSKTLRLVNKHILLKVKFLISYLAWFPGE